MKTKRWVALLLCALLLGSLFPVNALADSEYTEYSISVFADGNGTASADKTSAAKGEKVTLTTTPNPGYHFDRWESDDVTINVKIFDYYISFPLFLCNGIVILGVRLLHQFQLPLEYI